MSNALQLHLVAQGDRVVDASPSHHEITVHRGCKIDHGVVVFDGSDDAFLELPALDVDFSDGLTLEAWVYYESFQAWSRILDFGNGEKSDNILLSQYQAKGVPVFEVYDGKKQQQVKAKKEALPLSTWVHFAATLGRDGAATIFVHGKELPLEKAATAALTLPRKVRRSKFLVGKSSWGSEKALEGRLMSLRLYNRPLEAREIRINMREDLTGTAHGNSFPVDFHLHDGKRESVLYTLGGGQPLELEIVNTSRGDLVLEPVKGATAATKDAHHFGLCFRPGTLHKTSGPKEAVRLSEDSAKSWSIHRQDEPDGSACLYLLCLKPAAVAPARSLTVQLRNVVPDGRGGSRGTNVELRYKNVSVATVPHAGKREHHLSMLHQRPDDSLGLGAANKPLMVQFADGWDTILNTGERAVTLRIQPNPVYKISDDPKAHHSVKVSAETELWLYAGDPTVKANGVEVRPFSVRELKTDTALVGLRLEKEDTVEADKPLDLVVEMTASGKARQSFLKLHVKNLPDHEDFDLFFRVHVGPMTLHSPKGAEKGAHFTQPVSLWGTQPLHLRTDAYGEVNQAPAASIGVDDVHHGPYLDAGSPQLTLKARKNKQGSAEIHLDNTANQPGKKAGAGMSEARIGIGGTGKDKKPRDFYLAARNERTGKDDELLEIDTRGDLHSAGRIHDLMGILMPAGSVTMWAGKDDKVPQGWLLCDGKLYPRGKYQDLFAAVSTTYGKKADAGDKFRVPDLRSRFPVGAGTGTGEIMEVDEKTGARKVVEGKDLHAYELADHEGFETVPLISDEMPKHSHAVDLKTTQDGIHNHRYGDGEGRGYGSLTDGTDGDQKNWRDVSSAGAHKHDVKGATKEMGKGAEHENRPPYLALNFIIKT